MILLNALKKLLTPKPAPRCPTCGSEMSRGYTSASAIVEPMCPMPHAISRIPTIADPALENYYARAMGSQPCLPS